MYMSQPGVLRDEMLIEIRLPAIMAALLVESRFELQ